MVCRKKNNLLLIFLIIPLLSGCTATYNLEVSPKGISENLEVKSDIFDDSNYYIPAYYNSIGDEYYDVDVNQKLEGIDYYNTLISKKKIKLDYFFKNSKFFDANIANSFYSAFVHKRYDYDEDGVEDYYVLSASGDFSAFNLYKDLTEVVVKIETNCEVIKSNADEIDGNVYIWYLTPSNIPSINMVYNPDVVVDNRTFIQKFLDGVYFNNFTISLSVAIILFGLYMFFRWYSNKKNKI